MRTQRIAQNLTVLFTCLVLPGLAAAESLEGSDEEPQPEPPVLTPAPAVTPAEPPVLTPAPEPPAATTETGTTPTLHGQLQLSLDDAIAMGLENNLDVEIQRHAPFIAGEDATAAWGAYDPELFGELGYESTETPIASSLQQNSALVDRKTDGEGGLRGLLPWVGASYGITFTGSRQTTTSSISSLSPELRSGLLLNASVPLLRDLVWNQTWTAVKSTGILYDRSRQDFRSSLMDVVRNIEESYWSLAATKEQLRVAQKSLEAAQALLEQTQTQYEVGVVSRVEVTEAEAGVAEREVNLIVAENDYRGAQDRLIDQVLGPYLTAGSRLEIDPTDAPDEYVPYDINVELAVEKAFQLRPELAAAKYAVDNQKVQLRFRKNQRLPKFNVDVGYGYQGLAGEENPDRTDFSAGTRSLIDQINTAFPGTVTPLPPPQPLQIEDDYGSTYDDYFSEDGPSQFSVRGVVSIPFPNTTARANARKAELELRRAKTQTRRIEQTIILEVRDAARDLLSAQRGIDAAERRRLAAEEQLRAERIRLEHGESTPFDVLERERDLVDAESQKIGALREYRVSVVDLDRAQGTILRSRNIVIEDASALR
ncbi:MAG: TolC family protein [Proteobacteria bacterium]|nr:TolC family protein [Pseudomonadota bacterium]